MTNDPNEEIRQQYLQACVELGNIEYQATVLREELESLEYRAEKITNKMKAINERGAKLNAVRPTEESTNEQQSSTEAVVAAI